MVFLFVGAIHVSLYISVQDAIPLGLNMLCADGGWKWCVQFQFQGWRGWSSLYQGSSGFSRWNGHHCRVKNPHSLKLLCGLQKCWNRIWSCANTPAWGAFPPNVLVRLKTWSEEKHLSKWYVKDKSCYWLVFYQPGWNVCMLPVLKRVKWLISTPVYLWQLLLEGW